VGCVVNSMELRNLLIKRHPCYQAASRWTANAWAGPEVCADACREATNKTMARDSRGWRFSKGQGIRGNNIKQLG
jgi:hypothetical protein